MKQKKFSLFEYSEKISNDIGQYLYDETSTLSGDNYLYAYQYLVFSIISTLMWFLSGLAIASIFGNGLQYFMFCIVFGMIRSCCGGLHLDKHSHCFYTTLFLTVSFTLISSIITSNSIFLLAIGFASIVYKSWCVPKAVETTADYTPEENIMFRRRFCGITSSLMLVDIILICAGYEHGNNFILQLANCISVSMLLCALMLDDVFERLLKFIWKEN